MFPTSMSGRPISNREEIRESSTARTARNLLKIILISRTVTEIQDVNGTKMTIAVKQKGEMMDDVITREDALNAINRIWDKCEEIEAHLPEGDPDKTGYKMIADYLTVFKYLSAQPERTKRIIGKSRDGMTMWYQCESCNEPVDEKDLFCSGCGRRLTDG
jgi:hypothetical protein